MRSGFISVNGKVSKQRNRNILVSKVDDWTGISMQVKWNQVRLITRQMDLKSQFRLKNVDME